MRAFIAPAFLCAVALGGAGMAEAHARVLVLEGTREVSGRSLAWRRCVDVRQGRFAEFAEDRLQGGAVTWSGSEGWEVDESGGVHPLNADFAQRRLRSLHWVFAHGALLSGPRGAADDEPFTQEIAGGLPVTVSRGAAGTQVTIAGDLAPETWTLSDFREVALGVAVPFSEVMGAGEGGRVVRVSKAQMRPDSSACTTTRPIPVNPIIFSDGNGRAEVPIEFDGRVVVRASINGSRPLPFIVDTGGHNILSSTVAASLGLTLEGRESTGGAGGARIESSRSMVGSVDIGGAKLVNQPFLVLPLPYPAIERGKDDPIAGILGLQLFERAAVTIDYAQRRLVIAPPASTSGSASGRLPIEFIDDTPLVNAALDGRPGLFFIDTGNASTTMLHTPWAMSEMDVGLLRQGERGVAMGVGGLVPRWTTRGHAFSVGGFELGGLPVSFSESTGGAFASRATAGNIGTDILANFAITFDYQNATILLRRTADYTPPAPLGLGAAFAKVSPDLAAVVAVEPGGPADRAGIVAGDRIHAVNGQSLQGLSTLEIGELIRQTQGPLQIRIERGDKTTEVSLER